MSGAHQRVVQPRLAIEIRHVQALGVVQGEHRVGVFLQVAGYLVMRKIVNIEV